jgi:hypothetical protein
MKILHMSLAALLLASAALASAQPNFPSDPGAPVKPPAGDGIAKPPAAPMKVPWDPGMVVVPPKVDPESIKTPPKNIDPEIIEPTDEIDRRNRKKSEDKQRSQKRLKKPETNR